MRGDTSTSLSSPLLIIFTLYWTNPAVNLDQCCGPYTSDFYGIGRVERWRDKWPPWPEQDLSSNCVFVFFSVLVRFPLLRQDTEDKQLGKILARGFRPCLLCPAAVDMCQVEHHSLGKASASPRGQVAERERKAWRRRDETYPLKSTAKVTCSSNWVHCLKILWIQIMVVIWTYKWIQW